MKERSEKAFSGNLVFEEKRKSLQPQTDDNASLHCRVAIALQVHTGLQMSHAHKCVCTRARALGGPSAKAPIPDPQSLLTDRGEVAHARARCRRVFGGAHFAVIHRAALCTLIDRLDG